MCIFTLASVFSASFAWFEMIKNVDENASNMPVEKKERFSKISYYNYTGTPTDDACNFSLTPYASITYNAATKTFNQPVNGQGQTIESFDLVMDQYDPMNKHKPILVIAELSEDVDTANSLGVQVIARTTTTDFLGRKNEQHQTKYTLGSNCPLKVASENGTDYYPLSSVICFRTKAFSTAEYNAWISGSSSYAVTGLSLPQPEDAEQNETPTTWLNPVDHNFAEADVDADSSSFEQESTVYRSDPEGSAVVKYIAIVVDYYDLAIEYIYSAFLGNTTLEQDYDYILNFTCDWRWEIG